MSQGAARNQFDLEKSVRLTAAPIECQCNEVLGDSPARGSDSAVGGADLALEPRRPGRLKGQIVIAPDFDVLPPEVARAFEGYSP